VRDVGFIALSGMSVLNDLVPVQGIRQALKEGRTLDAAVAHAAEAGLMTELVAALGFVPMAVSTGMGGAGAATAGDRRHRRDHHQYGADALRATGGLSTHRQVRRSRSVRAIEKRCPNRYGVDAMKQRSMQQGIIEPPFAIHLKLRYAEESDLPAFEQLAAHTASAEHECMSYHSNLLRPMRRAEGFRLPI